MTRNTTHQLNWLACLTLFLLGLLLSYTHALPTSVSIPAIANHTLTTQAHGLGGAMTAIGANLGAVLFNPAALSYPGSAYSFQSLDYDNRYFKTYQGHFYYNKPLGLASIKQQDFKGNTLSLNAIGLGFFSNNGISWGINYKNIHGTVNTQSISGWSADMGLLFRLVPWLTAGFVANDLYSQNLNLNPSYSLGFSGYLSDHSLLWSIQNTYNNKPSSRWLTHCGIEYGLTQKLSVRAGMSQRTLHTGTAIQLPFLKLSIGLSNDLNNTDGTYYSVAARIGPGSKMKQYRKRYALFKQRSFAVFSIGSNLKRGQSEFSLLGGKKIGANDLLTLIHHATNDPTCTGFIIRVGSLPDSIVSVAMIEEVRSALLKAKKKNKRIHMYIESSAELSEYYLASIGDNITMPPLGTITQFGLKLEVLKAQSFLKKLGIHAHTLTSGTYKGNTSSLSDTLTPHDTAQLQDLIEQLFSQVRTDILRDRPQATAGLATLSDGSIITAKDALKLKLVDELAYWSDLEIMNEKHKKNGTVLALSDFEPIRYPSIIRLTNRLAVVEIEGPITQGASRHNIIFGGRQTGADEVERILYRLKKDRSVRGIILRINSPGGSVLASDRIYNAVEAVKKSGKPVYTSMGALAASGGYYVATNSNQIFSNRSTLTGSIGVIQSFLSFQKLTNELGISATQLKTGSYMGLYGSFHSLTADQKKHLMTIQDCYYQTFVQRVKRNRHITSKDAYTLAQGHIVDGTHAKTVHLVDQLGGLYDSIDELSNELNLDNPYVVFVRPGASAFSSNSASSYSYSSLGPFSTLSFSKIISQSVKKLVTLNLQPDYVPKYRF